MFVIGALDDLIDVSPPAKLAGQVLAASLLSLFGVTMFYFRMPFNFFHTDTVVLSSQMATLVTALWVVLLTNAINLIDGIDGLAAGIVAIAGGALFLFADRLFKQNFLDGTNIGPLVAIIAVGVCVGFLPFNWNPAKIIHGRRRRALLRCLARGPNHHHRRTNRSRVLGQHVLLLRPAVDPRHHPRRADDRHRVLLRAAARETPALASSRRGPHAPSPHATRARSAPHGCRSSGRGPRSCRVSRSCPPIRTRETRWCPSQPRRWPSCCSPGSTPGSARPRALGAPPAPHRAPGRRDRRPRGTPPPKGVPLPLTLHAGILDAPVRPFGAPLANRFTSGPPATVAAAVKGSNSGWSRQAKVACRRRR